MERRCRRGTDLVARAQTDCISGDSLGVKALQNTRTSCDLPPTLGSRMTASFYRTLGLAVDAMAKSDEYCQYPIACVTMWIEPAIRHEQIHFFRDASGEICGYMTWAWLAEDTERRLLHDPNVLLHISEWNEGEPDFPHITDLISGNFRQPVSPGSRSPARRGAPGPGAAAE